MSPFRRIQLHVIALLERKDDERKRSAILLILIGAALVFAGSIVKDVHEISPIAGTVLGLVVGWAILAAGLALVAFGVYLTSAPPTPPRK